MATKADLQAWIREALEEPGGSTSLVDVARHIRVNQEGDLKASGDLFFTWQYDMRWAATVLRKEGMMGEGWTLTQ